MTSSVAVLMGSNSKRVPARRLCDLLEEQQEPFMLDVYILEHDYSVKRWDFGKVDRWWWSFHQSGGSRLMKKMTSNSAVCSRTLKYLLDKLVPCKTHGTEILEIRGHQDIKNRIAARECGRSSSSGTSRYCDPFFNSDMAKHSSVSSSSESFRASNLSDVEEVMEDSTQLSPVSVLEMPVNETSPAHNYRDLHQSHVNLKLHSSVAEESVFFLSLWETLVQTVKEKHGFEDSELQEIFGYGSSSQYFKTKLVLHQTRQLFLDYVREVVALHVRKERMSSWSSGSCMFQRQPGREQLAKFICEQICSWGRTADDITSTAKLLEADFSRNELTHFSKHETHSVVCVIEAAIFGGIMDELASDLLCLPIRG